MTLYTFMPVIQLKENRKDYLLLSLWIQVTLFLGTWFTWTRLD